MTFVNRKSELQFLENQFKSNNASFIPIYGRRRVGKTELIREFTKNKPSTIYYFASELETQNQIEELKQQINKVIPNSFLQSNTFTNWSDFFNFLETIWPKDKKIIFAIDEVTYIIKQDKEFSSVLQKFWDLFLSQTQTLLILSGSMQSLMLKEVLGYSAPLYGRRSGQIHLKEFTFKDFCNFFEKTSLKNLIEIYSITGGVAKYLTIANKYKTANSLIKNEFLNPNSFFYNEALLLLAVEFREVTFYNNILKSIAVGKNSLNHIAQYMGVEEKKINSYLEVLIRLNFVKREIPVTLNEKKFRGANYFLHDNFLKFWYGFIDKTRSEIEMNKFDEAMQIININFNKHVSFVFEEICREFLFRTNYIMRIGREWGKYKQNNETKSFEIDIVGINEDNSKILFSEVKWRDNVDGKELLNTLKNKAKHVKWRKEQRDEDYILFAKSFKNKPDNCTCYDLDDLKKVFQE